MTDLAWFIEQIAGKPKDGTPSPSFGNPPSAKVYKSLKYFKPGAETETQ